MRSANEAAAKPDRRVQGNASATRCRAQTFRSCVCRRSDRDRLIVITGRRRLGFVQPTRRTHESRTSQSTLLFNGDTLVMTILLDDRAQGPSITTTATTPAARRLRTSMAAVRVSFTALGVHRTLSPQQKSEAADTFGAADQYISAGKKLFDTRHPAFRAVTGVRTRILQCWKGMTLPYPEPGLRLIRIDQIDLFNTLLSGLAQDLAETVSRLDGHYAELQSAARQRLGRLFNAADYPPSLDGLFGVEWEFPSIEPPAYLQCVNPALCEQECRRIAARFDESLALAEQAFRAELRQLIGHLTERLHGAADGKPKVFRLSMAAGN